MKLTIDKVKRQTEIGEISEQCKKIKMIDGSEKRLALFGRIIIDKIVLEKEIHMIYGRILDDTLEKKIFLIAKELEQKNKIVSLIESKEEIKVIGYMGDYNIITAMIIE